eukprot:gene6638-4757_t
MADLSQMTAEQRISDRRARIKKRLDAARGINSDEVQDSLEVRNPCAERVEVARSTMAQLHAETMNAVSQFLLSGDAAEAERRDREEGLCEARTQKQATELEENEPRLRALAMQFDTLLQIKVPHELHKSLEEQKEQCLHILEAKDEVIRTLIAMLKDKEEDYVNLLRRNNQQVNELVVGMRAKTNEYLDKYTVELEEVEKTYMEHRKEYLESCASEIQQLVKTRRTKEVDYRRRREAKLLEAQGKLSEKHEENYEDFNDCKKGLEENIFNLRQEREKCKADYMLNGERLNYNLQVLRERVKENKNAQAQYKRKLAKLQETLGALVARYQESDRKYQKANKELTTQLHRVGVKYKELQKKFQFFEKADKDKFRQLWNMHDQASKALVHRCLQADRVLFEDILSMPWKPPEMSFWPEEQEDLEGLDEEEEEQHEELIMNEPALMLFQILQNQAPFLVDENVREAISAIEGTTQEQAAVEGILTTLKIHKNAEVSNLLEYFMVESEEETLALINPQEAIRALNAFLEERTARNAKEKEREAKSETKTKESAKEKAMKRFKQAEKNYWKQLTQCVPKEHLHVWEALETGLERYLAQLQQRKALVNTTDSIRAQNDELKSLLRQYMHSGINYQLFAPPDLALNAAHAGVKDLLVYEQTEATAECCETAVSSGVADHMEQ